MNTSLKTLLTLIALAVCTAVPVVRGADTTAPAPTEPTVAKPNKAIERLQAQLLPLNLTDDQKAKVDAIIQDEEKSAAALRKDKGVAKADRQAERQELRQDTLDKIRAVLTPEQAAKFGKRGKSQGKVKTGGKADDKAEDKADSASAL
jgi:Spy/CpxP family protein refolding chaperone